MRYLPTETVNAYSPWIIMKNHYKKNCDIPFFVNNRKHRGATLAIEAIDLKTNKISERYSAVFKRFASKPDKS